MTGPPYDLVGVSAYAFVALVWGIVAIDAWSFRLASHPRNALSRLLAPLTTTLACYYVVYALVALLLPSHSATAAPRWFDLTDVALLASIALFRHLAWHTRFDTTAPSRTWLALVYGSAALLAAAQVFPELIPAATADARKTLARIPLPFYVVGMLALGLRDMRRFARPGRWTSSAVAARAADVLTVALLVVGAATVFVVITATARERWTVGYQQPPPLLNAGLGLLIVVPIAARILGDVVRRLLFTLVVLAASGLVWTGVHALGPRIDSPVLQWLVGFGATAALVFGLLGSQRALITAIDRLVFRRGRRRRAELQGMLQTLSPELGARECCRRVAEAAVRIMRLRGVAILLTRGRGEVVAGDLDLATLLAAWGDGRVAALLPSHPFSLGTLRELPPPVREALAEAEVVGGVAIASPRQRWGAALVTAGALGTGLGIEDRQAVGAMADQLALILDGTELLERALVGERALAHAEKLAGIGATAARMPPDIRNPVTAARSLAQQLARDASVADREAAAIILEELDRVERQIGALLRFARREEYRFEPLDLGGLVRTTLEQLRARLDDAGVAVDLRAGGAVLVRADREKLRQALLNLIENALDAMRAAGGRLEVTVQNGR